VETEAMPWNVRRVVTGRNASGRSCVVSDDAPTVTAAATGFGRVELWALPAGPLHPESRADPASWDDELEPPPGAITWKVLRVSPTGAVHRPPREQLERDSRYDPNRPGVHRTDTLDWITVFEGEIELILDEERVRLGPGDCVIQRGTSHAWQAVAERDCVFGALMLRSIAGAPVRGVGPRNAEAELGVGPRRVVTHGDPGGRSRCVADGEPANVLRLAHGAGMAYSDIWQTLGPWTSPEAGGDTPSGDFEFYPVGGGACWKHMVIPPDHALATIDPDALAAEYAERAPGMAAGGEHDPDRPGRHRTNSIDLIQILSGRITLQLDDDEVDLAAGDFVVQQGTWHAWSNRGDEPCVFQAMMIATGPLSD